MRNKGPRAPFWNDWSWRLIGVALLGVILWQVGVVDLGRILLRVDPLAVVAAVLLAATILLLRGVRWWVLCGGLGIGVPVGQAVRIYLLGTFVGISTPGRVGDVVKAYYVKDRRSQGGLAAGIASVVWDRLLDVGQISALGLGAAAVLPGVRGIWGPPLVGVALVAFVVASTWGPTREGLLGRPLGWALQRLPGGDGVAPPTPGAGHVWLAQIITAATVALFAAETLVLARGVGITEATPWQLAVLSALGTLAGLAPITIFGIGTRDAVFVAAAPVLGQAQESMLALSLLLLSLYLVAAAIGWGAWAMSSPSARRPPSVDAP